MLVPLVNWLKLVNTCNTLPETPLPSVLFNSAGGFVRQQQHPILVLSFTVFFCWSCPSILVPRSVQFLPNNIETILPIVVGPSNANNPPMLQNQWRWRKSYDPRFEVLCQQRASLCTIPVPLLCSNQTMIRVVLRSLLGSRLDTTVGANGIFG